MSRGSRSSAIAAAMTTAALVAAGCGGGGGGDSSSLALGEQASVQHAKPGAAEGTPVTILGVTVLAVRAGTQEELEEGGFSLDPEEKELKPYYVDVRYENQGDNAIERQMSVSLRDEDDNLINPTVIISLGGPPFENCPTNRGGDLEPGDSYESCSLFLVDPDREPRRVTFLPSVPGIETDWVYWDATGAEAADE